MIEVFKEKDLYEEAFNLLLELSYNKELQGVNGNNLFKLLSMALINVKGGYEPTDLINRWNDEF